MQTAYRVQQQTLVYSTFLEVSNIDMWKVRTVGYREMVLKIQLLSAAKSLEGALNVW
jgi:hypothetical protein